MLNRQGLVRDEKNEFAFVLKYFGHKIKLIIFIFSIFFARD